MEREEKTTAFLNWKLISLERRTQNKSNLSVLAFRASKVCDAAGALSTDRLLPPPRLPLLMGETTMQPPVTAAGRTRELQSRPLPRNSLLKEGRKERKKEKIICQRLERFCRALGEPLSPAVVSPQRHADLIARLGHNTSDEPCFCF